MNSFTHSMESRTARGFGSWKQCLVCGATFHGKLWWLGGFKSKEEPPCAPHMLNATWVAGAERIDETEEDD